MESRKKIIAYIAMIMAQELKNNIAVTEEIRVTINNRLTATISIKGKNYDEY